MHSHLTEDRLVVRNIGIAVGVIALVALGLIAVSMTIGA